MTPEIASSWVGLVRLHLGWYPLSELRDIYKLLYQGVMGAEHNIASADGFTQHLKGEYDRLVPEPDLQPIEPVRPDHSLVRVNLGAYKASGGQIEVLVPLLLASTRVVQADPGNLRTIWSSFCKAVEKGQFHNYPLEGTSKFSSWIDQHGYPAVHHSETYRVAYHPAYRLISAQYLSVAGLSDAG